MSFSERYGYKPIRNFIQLESMDEPLRNGLWSILDILVFQGVENANHQFALVIERNKPIKTLCQRLWLLHFKEPTDTLNDNWQQISKKIRAYYFSCPWNEAYDLLEFVHDNLELRGFPGEFAKACNSVLQREMSAYRFVSGRITPITEEEQIAEIEKAAYSDKEGVRLHIRRSLDLLSSRTNPDYRNSIKESISAVESVVSSALGDERGTLGQLLKKLDAIHPALKSAFSNLYGYTSDEGGIRHALLEADSVTYDEAMFFLVSCSAFVNYVHGKIGNLANQSINTDAVR